MNRPTIRVPEAEKAKTRIRFYLAGGSGLYQPVGSHRDCDRALVGDLVARTRLSQFAI
jgi:hypothetical protein